MHRNVLLTKFLAKRIFVLLRHRSLAIAEAPAEDTAEATAETSTTTSKSDGLPSCSKANGEHMRETTPTRKEISSNVTSFISPSQVLPFPNALLKKISRKAHVKKRSIIANDTLECDEIAAQKRKLVEKKVTKKRNQDVQRIEKKILIDETQEEEEDTVPYDDSSSGVEEQ